jgi:WhiB family transcriptional regulator, redox-sensing transcriptional regulator
MAPLEAWRSAAACRAFPTSWWFVADDPEALQAFLICGTCSVQSECLEAAFDHGEVYGIWAATSPEERGRIRDRRRQSTRTTDAK